MCGLWITVHDKVPSCGVYLVDVNVHRLFWPDVVSYILYRVIQKSIILPVPHTIQLYAYHNSLQSHNRYFIANLLLTKS